MKKTNTKTKSGSAASKAKTKEPILSTGKKIGLTVYFTFIFTLMGIMGLQIWMNTMNGDLSNNSLTSPQLTQTEQSYDELTNGNSAYNNQQNSENRNLVSESQQNNPSITNPEIENSTNNYSYEQNSTSTPQNTNYSNDNAFF